MSQFSAGFFSYCVVLQLIVCGTDRKFRNTSRGRNRFERWKNWDAMTAGKQILTTGSRSTLWWRTKEMIIRSGDCDNRARRSPLRANSTSRIPNSTSSKQHGEKRRESMATQKPWSLRPRSCHREQQHTLRHGPPWRTEGRGDERELKSRSEPPSIPDRRARSGPILLILPVQAEESVRNARGKATKSASDRAPIARRNVSLRF